MTERLRVNCRTATPADTAPALAFDQGIWEGQDYIPYVWEDWLADRRGRLLVAELAEPAEAGERRFPAGQVVGFGKLSLLEQGDWWLEGLRIDPALQGRGIATQLTEALHAAWLALDPGSSLRLLTMANRYPVHHISTQMGMRRLGVYVFYRAQTHPPAESGAQPDTLPFDRVPPAELAAAAALAQHNPAAAWVGELMDMGWQWAPARLFYLERAMQRGELWWWGEQQGLLAYHLDNDEGEAPHPYLELVACPPQEMAALLLGVRRLMGQLGYTRVDWTVMDTPELRAALEQAGYTCVSEQAAWAFGKDG
ncbi:MAG: GNAT family N-acetyltransferase [Chloroflexota bacterium]